MSTLLTHHSSDEIEKIPDPLISNNTFVSSLQFAGTVGNAGWSKFSSLFFLDNGISASQLAIITLVQAIAKFIGYPTYVFLYFYNLHSTIINIHIHIRVFGK